MGISPSKRVNSILSNSSEFISACDSAYTHCLSLTQHAFEGIFPYQLTTASDYIYATVSSSTSTQKHRLILQWVPSPPTQTQIDSALRVVARERVNKGKKKEEDEFILGTAQFREWAVVLFAEAVAGNAGKAVLARIPIGAAGIVGVGAATRSRMDLIGAAIGVYALGVATTIYLSLSG